MRFEQRDAHEVIRRARRGNGDQADQGSHRLPEKATFNAARIAFLGFIFDIKKKDHMGLRDKIALLLWRDVDGYQPELGSVSNHRNVSLLTRFRQARRWFAEGWAANWKWWVTTIIATCAVAAAIAPLYLNVTKPSEQVDARGGELLLQCVEERKCIIRIEPIPQRHDKVIASPDGNGRNHQRAPKQ